MELNGRNYSILSIIEVWPARAVSFSWHRIYCFQVVVTSYSSPTISPSPPLHDVCHPGSPRMMFDHSRKTSLKRKTNTCILTSQLLMCLETTFHVEMPKSATTVSRDNTTSGSNTSWTRPSPLGLSDDETKQSDRFTSYEELRRRNRNQWLNAGQHPPVSSQRPQVCH
jgi:hypothetical protein